MTSKNKVFTHPPPYADNDPHTMDDDTYFIFNEVPDADDIMKSLVFRLQKKWVEDYKKIEERYNIRNIQFKDKMDSDIQKVRSIYQKKIDVNNEVKDQELLNYNNIIEGRVARLVDGEAIPSYTPYTPPVIYNSVGTANRVGGFKSLYSYIFD
jgi:hypothetical protein